MIEVVTWMSKQSSLLAQGPSENAQGSVGEQHGSRRPPLHRFPDTVGVKKLSWF